MISQHFTPVVGEWVEVRPIDEILASLDANGDFEGMPFMPEMVVFAGRRFQVSAVAHKTCDTVNRSGARSVNAAVHLEDLRCDGMSHGGCQAGCLLFWKTRWLRRLSPITSLSLQVEEPPSNPAAREGLRSKAVDASLHGTSEAPIYRCQATTLPKWSRALQWWDVRQYWRDVRCGNVTLRHALVTLALASVKNLRRVSGGYRISLWLYGRAHRWLKGAPDPHGVGTIKLGEPTPDFRSNLRVGEIIQIKSHEEIYSTVNVQNRNRGLQIDEEMTKYCGGRYRVAARVSRIINEQSGRIMTFKNPCIVLDAVNCTGDYASGRLLCPRRITTYWREIWLKRLDEGPGSVDAGHR